MTRFKMLIRGLFLLCGTSELSAQERAAFISNEVDLQLILAVDISGSVDTTRPPVINTAGRTFVYIACYNFFMNSQNSRYLLSVVLPIVASILFLGGVGAYGYYTLSIKIQLLSADLASSTALLAAQLEQKTIALSDTLYTAEQNIAAVQAMLGGFEQTVGNISGTVNVLEKLSKTDPELLQKYSRVFFLNEHYSPERVAQIDSQYLYSEDNPEVIHAQVSPYLKAMLDGAKNAGITLYVKSAYRSFDEQSKLKDTYTVTYGAGTSNQFSADQGYSEHQLGTTADFITTGLGGQLRGFEKTAAYQWMLGNAHKFGFTLSYPEGNVYYIYEPWHWRFVGVSLATHLYNSNKHFYDLEQREIDEYLVNIFD